MPSIRSGRMRRPCSVWWTSSLSPGTGSTVQPPRLIVARALRRPAQPPRALSAHTVLPTGGNSGQPPPTGGFKTPVLIVRGRGPARWPWPQALRPQLARVANLPPPPAQRTVPRPLVATDPRGPSRYRPLIFRPAAALASNVPPPPAIHVRPWPAVVARDPWRGQRYRPTIVAAVPISRSIQYPRGPMIGRVPRQPVRPTVVIQVDSGAGIRPILPGRPQRVRPRPIVLPTLPARCYGVSTWSGAARARMQVPRPLVVPRPPQRVRPVIVVQVDSGAGSGAGYQTTQRRPLVVRRPAGPIQPPKLIAPAPHHLLQSPALHGPMPQPSVFYRRWSFGSIEVNGVAYRRTVAGGRSAGPGGSGGSSPSQPIPPVNPPQPGQPTMPPDLVAACIAWLRLQPAIVAAFADSVTTPAFVSDAETRGASPPYLIFYEPEEDEGYESVDESNRPSSLAEGRLGMELICPQSLGKLGTRQLAEQVVAVLNDAPLTFLDGTLVYLRRTDRHFPTFRDTGPGANVTVWKRVIEFKYMIERWAPQF